MAFLEKYTLQCESEFVWICKRKKIKLHIALSGAARGPFISQGEGCLFVQSFLVFLIGSASTAFHHHLFSIIVVLILLCSLMSLFQIKIPNASETSALWALKLVKFPRSGLFQGKVSFESIQQTWRVPQSCRVFCPSPACLGDPLCSCGRVWPHWISGGLQLSPLDNCKETEARVDGERCDIAGAQLYHVVFVVDTGSYFSRTNLPSCAIERRYFFKPLCGNLFISIEMKSAVNYLRKLILRTGISSCWWCNSASQICNFLYAFLLSTLVKSWLTLIPTNR